MITELAEQSAHDRASAIHVPVTTIDHLVEELRLEKVDFIKMDIEGAERHALAGARETLNRWQPRLAIASYHLPDDVPHIRAEVLAGNSRYEEILGPCLILHGRVTPETLFYL